jgi:hypothetical protein
MSDDNGLTEDEQLQLNLLDEQKRLNLLATLTPEQIREVLARPSVLLEPTKKEPSQHPPNASMNEETPDQQIFGGHRRTVDTGNHSDWLLSDKEKEELERRRQDQEAFYNQVSCANETPQQFLERIEAEATAQRAIAVEAAQPFIKQAIAEAKHQQAIDALTEKMKSHPIRDALAVLLVVVFFVSMFMEWSYVLVGCVAAFLLMQLTLFLSNEKCMKSQWQGYEVVSLILGIGLIGSVWIGIETEHSWWFIITVGCWAGCSFLGSNYGKKD